MSLPMTAGLAQAICALAIVLVLPFIDLPRTRQLKRHSSSQARMSLYRHGIAKTWIALATVVACSGYQRLFVIPRYPGDLPWLDGRPWLYAFATALMAVYFSLALWPGLHCMLNRRMRPRYAKAIRSLRFISPVSRKERRWWIVVSVTAGVTEELLFRGFLLEYLRGHLDGGPHLSLTLAWLLSSVAFGIGHAYQGWVGIMRTASAGLAFGLLAILTGNLVLPILLHCLIDLQVLAIYHPEIDAPEEAAALTAGCNCE
ncbi:CPBP family intramembrane metalloprotease [Dyella halodurans]|uniref:CPBP family intramembrane glutamic endopeptidase n=1 Tax=Dyella halodurans TaxID=1920171 RepID=A0ABV9C0T9_9GAMM|nr:CPBP family intramembrane glutamic endopeptidase [Dyella halodurans]